MNQDKHWTKFTKTEMNTNEHTIVNTQDQAVRVSVPKMNILAYVHLQCWISTDLQRALTIMILLFIGASEEAALCAALEPAG